MKANELRIGNLVSITCEAKKDVADTCHLDYLSELARDYFIIGNFSTDEINVFIGKELIEFSLSEIEPIPLTAEWFEKCGGRIGGEQVLFISMPKIKAELHFEMKPYGNVVVLKSDFGEFVPEDIKYVHQLQNLYFALTGEELTIKEDTK